MARRSKKKSNKRQIAAPPGTLHYTGTFTEEPTSLNLMRYDQEGVERKGIEINQIKGALDLPGVKWINYYGLNEAEKLQQVAEIFKIHPLIMESVLDVESVPRVEDFDDFIFFQLKMLVEVRHEHESAEHISFILGKGYLLCFQEKIRDVFDPIRRRIEDPKARVRHSGPDYLLNRLIDTLIDHYYVSINSIELELDQVEEQVLHQPNREVMLRILELKKRLTVLKRSIIPLNESIRKLIIDEHELIETKNRIYFSELQEHLRFLITTVDEDLDMLTSYVDLYLSNLSYKQNEVVSTLTIVGSIFIPLTFISSIYGMNFVNMPELQSEYGYFIALAVMLVLGVAMWIYMKRKDWF